MVQASDSNGPKLDSTKDESTKLYIVGAIIGAFCTRLPHDCEFNIINVCFKISNYVKACFFISGCRCLHQAHQGHAVNQFMTTLFITKLLREAVNLPDRQQTALLLSRLFHFKWSSNCNWTRWIIILWWFCKVLVKRCHRFKLLAFSQQRCGWYSNKDFHVHDIGSRCCRGNFFMWFMIKSLASCACHTFNNGLMIENCFLFGRPPSPPFANVHQNHREFF